MGHRCIRHTLSHNYSHLDRYGSDHAPLPPSTRAGHLEQASLLKLMSTHCCYVSATLGEGSSSARISALCMGLPIVSTNCGELADVAQAANHVWLADPGDLDHFHEMLLQACEDLMAARVMVDPTLVSEWRTSFASDREWAAWAQLMEEAAV